MIWVVLLMWPHLCFVLEQAGEVGGHGEDDDEDAGGQGHAAGEVLLGPGQQEEEVSSDFGNILSKNIKTVVILRQYVE